MELMIEDSSLHLETEMTLAMGMVTASLKNQTQQVCGIQQGQAQVDGPTITELAAKIDILLDHQEKLKNGLQKIEKRLGM